MSQIEPHLLFSIPTFVFSDWLRSEEIFLGVSYRAARCIPYAPAQVVTALYDHQIDTLVYICCHVTDVRSLVAEVDPERTLRAARDAQTTPGRYPRRLGLSDRTFKTSCRSRIIAKRFAGDPTTMHVLYYYQHHGHPSEAPETLAHARPDMGLLAALARGTKFGCTPAGAATLIQPPWLRLDSARWTFYSFNRPGVQWPHTGSHPTLHVPQSRSDYWDRYSTTLARPVRSLADMKTDDALHGLTPSEAPESARNYGDLGVAGQTLSARRYRLAMSLPRAIGEYAASMTLASSTSDAWLGASARVWHLYNVLVASSPSRTDLSETSLQSLAASTGLAPSDVTELGAAARRLAIRLPTRLSFLADVLLVCLEHNQLPSIAAATAAQQLPHMMGVEWLALAVSAASLAEGAVRARALAIAEAQAAEAADALWQAVSAGQAVSAQAAQTLLAEPSDTLLRFATEHAPRAHYRPPPYDPVAVASAIPCVPIVDAPGCSAEEIKLRASLVIMMVIVAQSFPGAIRSDVLERQTWAWQMAVQAVQDERIAGLTLIN